MVEELQRFMTETRESILVRLKKVEGDVGDNVQLTDKMQKETAATREKLEVGTSVHLVRFEAVRVM